MSCTPMSRRLLIVAASVVFVASGHPALAAGYDTPILYTARHMGMGGTAIGYVNDVSGAFHNPAGILGMGGNGQILIHGTSITGYLQSAPEFNDDDGDGINDLGQTRTDPGWTHVPFVAGGARINDWISAGLGLFPVASATGEYHYSKLSGGEPGASYHDLTKLLFLEISPVLAFKLPGNLQLGVGYRADLVSMNRYKLQSGAIDFMVVDAKALGWSFGGVRIGAQWQPVEWLSLGAVWRNKVTAELEAETATVYGQETGRATVDFILPMKVGLGARADFGPLSVTTDFEHTWNSQVEAQTFMIADADDPTKVSPIPNYAFWQNNITIRSGAEYRFLDRFAGRVGYIYDGQAANTAYPSAFGTPPATTHSFTVGAGYDGGPWEVNVAHAYRRGGVTIEPSADDPSVPAGQELNCAFCAKPGDYDLLLHGFYLDFSWTFGHEAQAALVVEPTVEDETGTEAAADTAADTDTDTDTEPDTDTEAKANPKTWGLDQDKPGDPTTPE